MGRYFRVGWVIWYLDGSLGIEKCGYGGFWLEIKDVKIEIRVKLLEGVR